MNTNSTSKTKNHIVSYLFFVENSYSIYIILISIFMKFKTNMTKFIFLKLNIYTKNV